METILRYRGTNYTSDEVAAIKALIAENPRDSRYRLSIKLCETWDWRQTNGALRDMVARGLMLALHRGGYLTLPAQKFMPTKCSQPREKPEPIPLDQRPLEARLSHLSLAIRQVRRTPHEKLFNSLLEQFHYLGYTQPVGEHLKHLVFLGDRPIACLVWSSAARHIGCRDRFIGWDQETRRRNLHLMAYNQRFFDSALGPDSVPRFPPVGKDGPGSVRSLGSAVLSSALFRRDLCRYRALCRDLLQGGQLETPGPDHRARQK